MQVRDEIGEYLHESEEPSSSSSSSSRYGSSSFSPSKFSKRLSSVSVQVEALHMFLVWKDASLAQQAFHCENFPSLSDLLVVGVIFSCLVLLLLRLHPSRWRLLTGVLAIQSELGVEFRARFLCFPSCHISNAGYTSDFIPFNNSQHALVSQLIVHDFQHHLRSRWTERIVPAYLVLVVATF